MKKQILLFFSFIFILMFYSFSNTFAITQGGSYNSDIECNNAINGEGGYNATNEELTRSSCVQTNGGWTYFQCDSCSIKNEEPKQCPTSGTNNLTNFSGISDSKKKSLLKYLKQYDNRSKASLKKLSLGYAFLSKKLAEKAEGKKLNENNNGVCDNTKLFSCKIGKVFQKNSYRKRWRCRGANGGKSSEKCYLGGTPAIVKGVCDNTKLYGCTSGKLGNKGNTTWRCRGNDQTNDRCELKINSSTTVASNNNKYPTYKTKTFGLKNLIVRKYKKLYNRYPTNQELKGWDNAFQKRGYMSGYQIRVLAKKYNTLEELNGGVASEIQGICDNTILYGCKTDYGVSNKGSTTWKCLGSVYSKTSCKTVSESTTGGENTSFTNSQIEEIVSNTFYKFLNRRPAKTTEGFKWRVSTFKKKKFKTKKAYEEAFKGSLYSICKNKTSDSCQYFLKNFSVTTGQGNNNQTEETKWITPYCNPLPMTGCTTFINNTTKAKNQICQEAGYNEAIDEKHNKQCHTFSYGGNSYVAGIIKYITTKQKKVGNENVWSSEPRYACNFLPIYSVKCKGKITPVKKLKFIDRLTLNNSNNEEYDYIQKCSGDKPQKYVSTKGNLEVFIEKGHYCGTDTIGVKDSSYKYPKVEAYYNGKNISSNIDMHVTGIGHTEGTAKNKVSVSYNGEKLNFILTAHILNKEKFNQIQSIKHYNDTLNIAKRKIYGKCGKNNTCEKGVKKDLGSGKYKCIGLFWDRNNQKEDDYSEVCNLMPSNNSLKLKVTKVNNYKMLLLVFNKTDVDFKKEGKKLHFKGEIEQSHKKSMLRQFKNLPLLISNGTKIINPEYDIYEIDEPIKKISKYGNSTYQLYYTDGIVKNKVDYYLNKKNYKSVFIIWNNGTIPVGGFGLGGTLVTKKKIPFTSIITGKKFWWNMGETDGEVFLHEWLHGIVSIIGTNGLPSGDVHGAEKAGYNKKTGTWIKWYFDLMQKKVNINGNKMGITSNDWKKILSK